MSCLCFIGGVHGVGKTSLLRSLSLPNHITTETCSDIIKTQSQKRNISIADVLGLESNQELLIHGIRAINGAGKKYLLDGHFSLPTNSEDLLAVPIEIFSEIRPSTIFLLENDAATISQRIMERDKVCISIASVKRRLEFERKCAITVANKLNISIIIEDGGHVHLIKSHIENILTRGN
jgi:adenylate kinase